MTHVEGADSIYVQLTSCTELLKHIQTELASVGPSAEPAVYCLLGQVCLATYSSDGLYYRCVTISEILHLENCLHLARSLSLCCSHVRFPATFSLPAIICCQCQALINTNNIIILIIRTIAETKAGNFQFQLHNGVYLSKMGSWKINRIAPACCSVLADDSCVKKGTQLLATGVHTMSYIHNELHTLPCSCQSCHCLYKCFDQIDTLLCDLSPAPSFTTINDYHVRLLSFESS